MAQETLSNRSLMDLRVRAWLQSRDRSVISLVAGVMPTMRDPFRRSNEGLREWGLPTSNPHTTRPWKPSEYLAGPHRRLIEVLSRTLWSRCSFMAAKVIRRTFTRHTRPAVTDLLDGNILERLPKRLINRSTSNFTFS
jgi:hypothetical protein